MTNHPRSPLRRIAPLAAVLLLAATMAGCSKKVTSVDADFTTPEGRFSADARLIVYPDAPVTVEVWNDATPDGPGPEDTLLETQDVNLAPGSLYGVILDGTPASGYQVLRREGNGGYAQLNDYVLNPTLRFLDSQWELYRFTDPRPSGFTPPSYLGRGVVAGVVTATSPLTNGGELSSTSLAGLTYTGQTAPRDSNFTLSWAPVAGATGYWVQIYQSGAGTEQEILQAVQPAPFALGEIRNFFVGFVPAPTTEYQLGTTGAQVLMRRTLLMGVQYLVRVVAVNAQGEMLAFNYGDWEYVRDVGVYYRFRLGATRVTPTRG